MGEEESGHKKAGQDELHRYRESLEELVRGRTVELSKLNEELKREIEERRRAEIQLEQRTQLLSTLLEVSNLVSSTMELRPLLEAILDRLKTIIDYRGAKIFIIRGDYLEIFAHRSTLSKDMEGRYIFKIQDAPVTQEAILNKRVIRISDIREDTSLANSFRKSAGEYMVNEAFAYTRSWMGLPLLIRDKVIGALTLDHSEPGFYQPHHAELGMAFANQVAIEFENVRLYNETLQKADEMKTMFAVHQAITSRLEWESVLKLISDEAKRLTNSARAGVFLVNDNDLVLSVHSGEFRTEFLGYRMPIGKSLAGKYLMQERTLLVNDAQSDPEVLPGLVEKAQINSFLSIPLLAGGKPIGLLTAADKVSGEFNADDERILSMLASTAVIALENARMYQEEKKRHQEDRQRRRIAEGLRDILAVLNSNRSLPEILEFIIGQAVKLMETNAGALYRLNKEDNLLTIEAAADLPDDYIAEMTIPLGQGVVGRAVAERSPIAVTDIASVIPKERREDPLKGKYFTWLLDGYKGLLAVPLFCKEETYGGIALYYAEARDFTKEEMDLAMTFADQVAMAIDNARLRAQTEEIAVAAERSRLARDLHDAVTQTLFSASLIAEVLPKMWEKNPGEVRKRLEELRQLTRGALAEMRTLLLELRPTTLLESNLKDLLGQLAEAVTGRGRIPIHSKINGQPILPLEVKIAFYRIAQEALNNIVKHAGASQVDMELTMESRNRLDTEYAVLRIRDNGRGFDKEKVRAENLGLNIMQERAQAVGAKIRIDSALGHGTEVYVEWCCEEGSRDG